MVTGISHCSIDEFIQGHSILYNELVHKLNLDNSWRKILNTLRNIGCEISTIRIQKMASSVSPSDILLDELKMRYASVGFLCSVLKQSDLMDALALIAEPERVKITKQPGSSPEQQKFLNDGEDLELECLAEGMPMPGYQWYMDNLEIPDQTSPKLLIKHFVEEDCGEYYCRVTQTNDDENVEIISHSVLADLHPRSPVFKVNLPKSQTVKVGSEVILSVWVQSRPPPTFMWLRGNTVLTNETSHLLKIKNINQNEEGNYRCCVTNEIGEIWSSTCVVTVYAAPGGGKAKNKATAKVALLIGNSNYKNFQQLKTPANDLVVLTAILKKLNFYVITLQDLSRIEMVNAVKWYCKALPKDAYALFYFVGHGFKLSNRYMMPVDCPPANEYCHSDCYCCDTLEKEVMETDIQFLIIVLDMCLTVPKGNPNLKRLHENVYEYNRKTSCSLLQCFATSNHLKSYESCRRENGLYVTHLRKFLDQDLPVTSVFQQAHEEFMIREGAKQKPSIYYDDAQHFRLTDHIIGDLELERKLKSISRIPPNQILKFKKVGLKVEVRIFPHRVCFINSVDIIFPNTLCDWILSAEYITTNIERSEWRQKKNGEWVLSLHDLQKVKSDLHVSVHLNRKSPRDENQLEIIASAIMDLGCFLIMPATLWYERKEEVYPEEF